MGLYSGGLIIGGIFVLQFWGSYFRVGLFSGGLIIGGLRYGIPDFILWDTKIFIGIRDTMHPKMSSSLPSSLTGSKEDEVSPLQLGPEQGLYEGPSWSGET